MANDDPRHDWTGRPGGPRLYLFWEQVDEAAIHTPLLGLFIHGLAIAEGDVEQYTLAADLWGTMYAFLAPLFIWRVGKRSRDRGDPWRAAALLGIGALPMPPAMIPDTVLTIAPVAFFTFPLVLAWSAACIILAVRAKPRPRSPRFRAVLLTVGALIWASCIATLFAIPEGDDFWFAKMVRVPVAALLLALIVKLLGEAATSWRGGSRVVADPQPADAEQGQRD